MQITETLRFLSPAIEKKNKILPVLEHVHITQNYAIAYNGMLALAAPTTLPLTCTPNGIMLEQAVKRYGNDFAATQLPNGNLYFKWAKFEITIPCTTDAFPMPDFSGTPFLTELGFLEKLRKLLPFTNTRDPSNPWMAGILLRDGKAWATCGHTLASVPVELPPGLEVNLPVEAVEAMLDIGEEPVYLAKREVQDSATLETSVVAFVAGYSEGRFLSIPSILTKWPRTLNIGTPPGDCGVLPGLFEAIHAVEPFGIGAEKVSFFLRDGYVGSARDNTGAKMEVEGLRGNWSWLHASVKLIEKHCKHLRIDSKFAAWAGEGIEGRARLGGAEL